MSDREYTDKLGLVNLDIADVPFGYNERVEFNQVMRQNLKVLDSRTLSATTSSIDVTYYVDPSGSDDNDGLTDTTAFRTIQKAVDLVPYTFSGRVVRKNRQSSSFHASHVFKIYIIFKKKIHTARRCL